PAGIEPATSRVSGGRSTGLSYGHPRWAEAESNRRPPPYQRGALPPELSAEWARLGSNRQPLVCKTSALRLSYSPVRQLRDKESNLDLHVQGVASCRLDDPGTGGRSPM